MYPIPSRASAAICILAAMIFGLHVYKITNLLLSWPQVICLAADQADAKALSDHDGLGLCVSTAFRTVLMIISLVVHANKLPFNILTKKGLTNLVFLVKCT